MNKIVSSMMNKLNRKLIIDKKAYSLESDVAEENDTSTDHDKENVLSNLSDNNLVLDKTMGINYGKESNTNHAKLVEIERNNLLNSINYIKENLNKKGNGKVKKGKKFKVFETLNNNNYVPPIIDINFNNNLNFNNFTTNNENEFINKKKVMNNSNNKEKKKNDFSEILERKLWNSSKKKKKKKTEVFVCNHRYYILENFDLPDTLKDKEEFYNQIRDGVFDDDCRFNAIIEYIRLSEDDLSFSEEYLLDIKLIFKAEECITNLAIEIYKGITELSPEYDFKIPNGTLLRVNFRIDKTFFVNSNEKIFNAINMVNRKWVYKQNDLSEPNIDMLQNLRKYDNISSTDSLMSQSDSEF